MKKHVLIVEDQSDMQALYRAMFKKDIDIEIFSASDAEQALEKIPQINPELVITDVSLPGSSGLELTHTITTTYPNIKVLVITGYERNQYYQKAIDKGAADLISKGNSDELRSSVRRLLNIDIDSK